MASRRRMPRITGTFSHARFGNHVALAVMAQLGAGKSHGIPRSRAVEFVGLDRSFGFGCGPGAGTLAVFVEPVLERLRA